MKDTGFLKTSFLLIFPVLVGSFLRYLWLQNNFHVLVSDEIAYHTLAVTLVARQPYGIPFWPPGYPMILAMLYRVFGTASIVGLYFNLLISILTVVLTAGVAYRLFGRSAALLSVWIISFMPSYILPVVL